MTNFGQFNRLNAPNLIEKKSNQGQNFCNPLGSKASKRDFLFVTCGFRVAQFKINPKKALKITRAHEKWHSARIIVESV